MKRIFAVAIFALLVCHNVQADVLSRADAAFKEGSYARALQLYRSAQAQGKSRGDVNYRIAVSLGKTRQWAAAIAFGQKLIAKNPNDARVLYCLGRLYADDEMPHYGYEINNRYYRGNDYPKTKSAKRPQQLNWYESDQQRVKEYFERAKIAAQTSRKNGKSLLATDQEIDLNFDLSAWVARRELGKLIRSLEKKYDPKFKPEKNEWLVALDETIDANQIYNAHWSASKKAIFLYNEIAHLDRSKTKHDTALALLAKGLFVQSYRNSLDGWATITNPKTKKTTVRAYPFDNLDALNYWRQLVNRFARDPIAPQTQLLIAHQFSYGTKRNLPRALIEYKFLTQKFPTSKWAGDARAQIQSITKRELRVDTMGAQPPGKAAKITISTRNVARVQFKAYRVPLEKVLASQKNLLDAKTTFTNFSRNFGTIARAEKLFGGRVASWSFATKDKGNHEGATETIDTPIKAMGAYAIVARAGNQLQFAQIMLVSDLAILKKVDRDNSFVYVANAGSGAPVSKANVTLKEYFWQNNKMRTTNLRGATNAQGFFDKKLTRQGNDQIAAFAHIGNRYALTGTYAEFTGGSYYGYYGGYNNARRDESKIYSLTDRPVYRPGQKVYFRQIVLRRVKGGDFKPLKNVKVQVTIHNPKWQQVLQKTFTTSEFGSINGEIVLKEDAALGEYSVQSYVSNFGYVTQHGGNRFRVEEYKRPEFKVQVFAPEKPARPGTLINARINAQYYFGGAVPNAKVKYTIRRSSWQASHRFPRPFDWLWTYWNEGDYNTGRRNIGGEGSGEIVKEGTVQTDAKGNAEVSFKAEGFPATDVEMYGDYWNPSYAVEAEITDASRRTIEAQGEVKVARQEYFAFLDSKQGYYQIGDKIPIEIATQDANDNRVAAKGRMVVYKLSSDAKGKETEEQVFQQLVSTQKDVPTFWNWQAKQAGNYRIAYEATDNWGQKIRASIVVWVAGKELDTARLRLKGVTLILEKRIYKEGETAKVLVVGDKPNATILLTQEAGGEVLRRDLLKLDGKSQQIEIPITKQHLPNFAIVASAVRDYEVFSVQQEIFVPPANQMLKVEVKSDKAQYKPGETGTFEIKATDWQGKPARAEVSLALIDASLLYIQKNYSPDLRTFYYGERRAVSTRLDSHRSGRDAGRLEDSVKYRRYESRGWTLPDGLGQLEIPPGNIGYYAPPMLPPNQYSGYGGNMYRSSGRAFVDGNMNALFAPSAPMAAPARMVLASEPMAAAGAARSARQMFAYDGVKGYPTKVLSEGNTLAEARIRENFSETAFWSPAVVTQNGSAKVKVTFPDSLTSWHADARGLSTQAQVGAGESEVETSKDVVVRLQAPRFFVERDQVVLSANVHNYLKTDKKIKVALETSDILKLISTASTMKALDGFITVKAGEEKRVDWTVDVVKEGTAEITMTAQSDEDADAVKMKFPVLIHGVQKFSSQSGVHRAGENSTRIKINLPEARQRGASTLNVQVNPSLAATMLDALPYLADYPYGCVEQTLSRFVPTVVAQKTLRESGIDLNDLRKRAQAYDRESKAKPIGERVKNSGYTYPTGMPNSRNLEEMASQLWHSGRGNNPIYDADKMSKMAREGLARLSKMQRPDGGWGWWQESEASDPYMSAIVVAGLITAQQAGESGATSMISRGNAYLEKQMADEDAEPLLCQIGYTLSMRGSVSARTQKILAGRLWERRAKLNPYSQSLLALALWNSKQYDKARVLVRNLENTAQVDAENGTARWKENANWWRWWNNDVETCAWALRAFVRVDPKNKLTPMIAKWLTTQARGNHWRSTKETANAVYALSDYVRVFKELDVDYTLTVRLGNKIERTYRVTKENALWFDNRFIVNDFLLDSGQNELTIEKRGKGTVYWSASSEYFSREEPITASGNEVAIKRRYFKLTRNPAYKIEQNETVKTTSPRLPPRGAGRITTRTLAQIKPIEEYLRSEINSKATLKSGDLIEVELTIDSKNDYEYLVFEDLKAAGLEPVDIRSGGARGDGLSSNVELRDEKVALFVDRLPQGTRVLRYRMRAEIPGQFHALPTNGYAMYAPEVRAISDEQRINVRDYIED